MGRATSVAEALVKEVKREKKAGPSVLVRATRKGFYGYPLADIRDPGDEFRMRVADLQVFDPKKPVDYRGQPYHTIEHEGKTYRLPTWCEDAKAVSSVVADDEEEDEGVQAGEDVL